MSTLTLKDMKTGDLVEYQRLFHNYMARSRLAHGQWVMRPAAEDLT